MSDRKAVNRYYPPDFDPGKHGSINKYRNSHPLRERAKRLSEGILVIRFEMPYNIWCGGCGKHIGMGVRYNADKTKVGNYYTTPIYRFRMKCHLCDHYFEMETNPMDCDYTIVTGATRKNQKWDMAENEQVLTEDRATVKKLAADPMFKLEHGVDDSKKLDAVAPTLFELEKTQMSWRDDFDQNRMLRKKFRTDRQELKTSQASDRTLLSKSSLDIKLVPEHEDDKKLAALLKYDTLTSSEEKQKQKRTDIANRSLFASKAPSSSTPSPSKTSPRKDGTATNVRKEISFIDRLKATKRRPGGFDDFSSSHKKVARRHDSDKSSVVLVKSGKGRLDNTRVSAEGEGASSDRRQNDDVYMDRSGQPGLGDRLVMTDQSVRVDSTMWSEKNDDEEDSFRDANNKTARDEDITKQDRCCSRRQNRQHHVDTGQFPDGTRNDLTSSSNGNSISACDFEELRENRNGRDTTKSLVSCDYSSNSESDE